MVAIARGRELLARATADFIRMGRVAALQRLRQGVEPADHGPTAPMV
jgi:hypothetical protein